MYRIYGINNISNYITGRSGGNCINVDFYFNIYNRVDGKVTMRMHNLSNIYYYIVGYLDSNNNYLNRVYCANGILICNLRRFSD